MGIFLYGILHYVNEVVFLVKTAFVKLDGIIIA